MDDAGEEAWEGRADDEDDEGVIRGRLNGARTCADEEDADIASAYNDGSAGCCDESFLRCAVVDSFEETLVDCFTLMTGRASSEEAEPATAEGAETDVVEAFEQGNAVKVDRFELKIQPHIMNNPSACIPSRNPLVERREFARTK